MADGARVAIACQGGGSHTAFTAGVLKRLLAEGGYEVVALSGTSGGAVCAYLAWFGLTRADPALGIDLLERFWRENAASEPWDSAINAYLVATSRLEHMVALPALSPYHYPEVAAQRFRALLEEVVPASEVPRGSTKPLLLIGAVDVLSGDFRAFSSERGEISVDAILASAAIPNIFRAVHLDGGTYWDGLFSQNPPVRELPDAQPDEIWVIEINPREREREPRTVAEILDRRNELAGNLSLQQELFFIGHINELVDRGVLADTKYRHIAIDTISLKQDLDVASKLDRDPHFLRHLMDLGYAEASAFLARRR
ncbi:MAG: patatin-like phospholipase family protein [Actinomycetota bacterium]|nr:patatin-like phospholipase family protein [Actinomycetota bacterium]